METISLTIKVITAFNMVSLVLNWLLMNQAADLHKLIRKDFEKMLSNQL